MKGLSRWNKFKMSAEDRKDPDKVFAKFCDSFGRDVSYRTARATLYKNFRQNQEEPIAELDIRLSRLIDECNFPTEEISKFIKRDILINSLYYYEVKKWATQQKEDGDDAITYNKVIDKCKKYEASVRDYIMMASDNSQLQTVYQQGSASVDEKPSKESTTNMDTNTEAAADQDPEKEAQNPSNLKASANDVDLRSTQHQMGNAQQ